MTGVAVFYDRFELGTIAVAPDGRLTFRYDPRWQGAGGAFAVSLTLPLGRDSHPDARIAPWIANLLPEEAQLGTLAGRLGLARADSLAILREIGGDTAGALSFDAPSERAAWRWTALSDHYARPDPAAALARHFDDLAERPFLIGEDGVRLSLAGGQRKSALAVLGPDGGPKLGLPGAGDRLAIPRNGAPSTVIVKPDNPHLPGIVENEAYCLALAHAIGIEAAQADIVTAGNRSALIVARYDRAPGRDGQILRRHQEDLAQALGVLPGRKYQRGTLPGPSVADLLGVGGAGWQARFDSPATLPAGARARLIDQLIFNILVANTDAHAKNYSLLLGPGDAVRMAPLYDVSTVLAWPWVNQYFAQNIAGRKRKPGDIAGRHWDEIAAEAGLNPRQMRLRVAAMVDRIVANGPATLRRLEASPGADAAMLRHLAALIEANALRILGRLDSAAD